MTEDEPPAAPPPDPVPAPAPTPRPDPGRFSRAVTAAWLLVIAAAGAALAASLSGDGRAAVALDRPVDTVLRLYEVALDMQSAPRKSTVGQRVWAVLVDSPTTRADAIRAYQDVLAAVPVPRQGGDDDDDARDPAAAAARDQLERALTVLLADSDRWTEAEGRLAAAGEGAAGGGDFAEVVRFAYAPGSPRPPPPGDDRLSRALGALPAGESAAAGGGLGTGWARDRLAAAAHRRRQQPDEARAAEQRSVTRGEAIRRRQSMAVGGVLLVPLAGAIIGLVWLLRRRGFPRLGDAPAAAPWTLEEGFAVFVRGGVRAAAIAFGYVVVLALASEVLGTGEIDPVWPTLVAGLLAIRYFDRALLRPHGARVRAVFGLDRPWSWHGLLAATAVLAFADIALAAGVGAALEAAGVRGRWSDSVLESLIFGSPTRRALDALEIVVWAPIIEEIVYRGLLYRSLRTRLSVGPAAVISAVVFAVPHLYAPGSLVILAVGAVMSALVYERTRSLWPAVLAHAFNNAMVVALQLSTLA